jgi:hypothetical protein
MRFLQLRRASHILGARSLPFVMSWPSHRSSAAHHRVHSHRTMRCAQRAGLTSSDMPAASRDGALGPDDGMELKNSSGFGCSGGCPCSNPQALLINPTSRRGVEKKARHCQAAKGFHSLVREASSLRPHRGQLRTARHARISAISSTPKRAVKGSVTRNLDVPDLFEQCEGPRTRRHKRATRPTNDGRNC